MSAASVIAAHAFTLFHGFTPVETVADVAIVAAGQSDGPGRTDERKTGSTDQSTRAINRTINARTPGKQAHLCEQTGVSV